jgi:hypothetical protein
MLDLNRETHVGFLRAAVMHLQERLMEAEKKLIEAERRAAAAEELKQKISEELEILRQQFFQGGREKSSRHGAKSPRRGKTQRT